MCVSVCFGDLSLPLQATPEIHTMAKFLIELCLPSYQMLDYKPSMLAAGALYLALSLCGDGVWVSGSVYYDE